MSLSASHAYFLHRHPLAHSDPDPPIFSALLPVLPLFTIITLANTLPWAIIYAYTRFFSFIILILAAALNTFLIPIVKKVVSLFSILLLYKYYHDNVLQIGPKDGDNVLQISGGFKNAFTSLLIPCIVGYPSEKLLLATIVSSGFTLASIIILLPHLSFVYRPYTLSKFQNPPIIHCHKEDGFRNSTICLSPFYNCGH